MKNYEYKISHTLIMISLIVLSISTLFIYLILSGHKNLILSASIALPMLLIFTIYFQIKFDKMYGVLIDEKILIFTTNQGWVSEEISMLWEDITIISCYRKYIISKKLYISTRYKSVTLNIRSFKNYKEMLRTIVDKTENNKNIRIDQTVYEMIQ